MRRAEELALTLFGKALNELSTVQRYHVIEKALEKAIHEKEELLKEIVLMLGDN